MINSFKQLHIFWRTIIILALVGSICFLLYKIFTVYRAAQIHHGIVVYAEYTCPLTRPSCWVVPEGAGSWNVGVIDSNGNNRMLGMSGLSNECPSISPDGLQVAFISGSPHEAGNLYVANINGSYTRQIINVDLDLSGCPSWTSDGSRIAFAQYTGSKYEPPDSPNSHKICVVERDGNNLNCLGNGINPGWSPDSQSFAFLDSSALIVFEWGGKDKVQLSEDKYVIGVGDFHEPITFGPRTFMPLRFSWSPDSKRIALYAIENDGLNGGIYVVNTIGNGHLIRIAEYKPPLYHSSAPSWSPDSQYIAFDIFKDSYSDPYNRELSDVFVAKEDGSSIIKISDGQSRSHMPKWSPDGAYIAYLTAPYGTGSYSGSAIYLTRPDGSDTKFVAKGESFAWSPDSQSIAFISDGNIYIVDIDNLDVHQVTYDGGEKTLTAWLSGQ